MTQPDEDDSKRQAEDANSAGLEFDPEAIGPDIEIERSNLVGYRPALPDWGVYLHWPEEGESWIHPSDVDIAKQLLPGPRVFKRTHWEDPYYILMYGKCRLRLRPSLWYRIQQELDLEIGQQVELLSKLGKNESGIFLIAEMLFDQNTGQVTYQLQRDHLVLEKTFLREDIRPTRVRHHLRTGFFRHVPPKRIVMNDEVRIDVGELGE